MGVFGTIKWALIAVAEFIGLRKKQVESDLRKSDQKAGRNEQRVADSDEIIRQGHEANEIDETVGRLDDDALNDSLRKRVRRPGNKAGRTKGG